MQPPIQVISKDCIWATKIHWNEVQADALVDCCPGVARQLLTHNALLEEFCR